MCCFKCFSVFWSPVNTEGGEKLQTLILWKAVTDQYRLKEGCPTVWVTEVGNPHWFLEVSCHSRITSMWPVCSILGCAEGAVCMFPLCDTAFRWASVCLSAGPDGLAARVPRTEALWGRWGSAGGHQEATARRCWLMYQHACYHGSEQKVQVPESFTCLLCESCPHSSQA